MTGGDEESDVPPPSGADDEPSAPTKEAALPEDENRFPIVGIGASAGGLEAIGQVLKNLVGEQMAFVVVQHLAPQYESSLTELLARTTHLHVATAADGLKIEPGYVYVIPPNADLAVLHGVLHLMTPGPGVHLPIDFFFRALAQDQGPLSVGIVLSGTGTDGTYGLKAIKDAGGITMVQDPATAKYDGMPRSALDSGHTDYCLTTEALAAELNRISAQPHLAHARIASSVSQETMGKLFVLLRSAFGTDLSYYKQSTIERRLERRMALQKISRLDDYLKFLLNHPEELSVLYHDILINVTSFFRDNEPFEALKTIVFPRIVQRQRGQHKPSIRIWVPGCSTGEEPFSIAMCLLEYLGDEAQDYTIQIFATDIDDDAIQRARRSIYPQNIASDVSPERLRRFFVHVQDNYQVCRTVRDLVVFSTQNVTKDPPFSRLDLISCRNLLIYLQAVLQKKVMRILHYALNPDGFLLLGTSESVGDSVDMFTLEDRKNKIYSRRNVQTAPAFEYFAPMTPGAPASLETAQAPSDARPLQSLQQTADRKLLERFGPPAVVINQNMEVLQFRGQTAPFIEHPPGPVSLNLLKLIRADLHASLRSALHKAIAENSPVIEPNVRFRNDEGAIRTVDVEIFPIHQPQTAGRCFVVAFVVQERPPAVESPEGRAPLVESRVRELERELEANKQYLQSTVEELETINEELQAANEELQSANEELQSTNEELQTSKEELQSTNEELNTVNDELRNRMLELSQTNDDLSNLLGSSHAVTLIVDQSMRIRRFTHAAEKLFHLVAADLGRSVTYLQTFLRDIDVAQTIDAAIRRAAAPQVDVLGGDGRWYTMLVSPYETGDHTLGGAVISFLDIDLRRRLETLGTAAAEYAARSLATSPHPIMILDEMCRVIWANDHYYRVFQASAAETLGNLIQFIGNGQWAEPRLRSLINQCLSTGLPFQDFVLTHDFEHIGHRTVTLSGSRNMGISQGERTVVLLVEE